MKITPYFIKWKDMEADEVCLDYFETSNDMFIAAAKMCAFSDCYAIHILEMSMAGRDVHYIGWEPDMEFIFKDNETGEVVFDGFFPEFDH